LVNTFVEENRSKPPAVAASEHALADVAIIGQ
jgi:hypothetical protein